MDAIAWPHAPGLVSKHSVELGCCTSCASRHVKRQSSRKKIYGFMEEMNPP